MMAESRKIMQEDRLSQKYSITPCNAPAPRCVLPPYLHSARQFTAGIYSSHRGLQRLRGRSSQQRGSAGHLLCRRGDMLSVTWGFTGPWHTWALHQLSPISLSCCYPHPKSHCSMGKAGCSQQAKLYHKESTKASRLRRQVRAASAGFLVMWPGIGLVSLRWEFLF